MGLVHQFNTAEEEIIQMKRSLFWKTFKKLHINEPKRIIKEKKCNCHIEQIILWSTKNEALNHKREPVIMFKQQKISL